MNDLYRVQWRRQKWASATGNKHRLLAIPEGATAFVEKLRRNSRQRGPLEWVRVDSRPLAGDWQPILAITDELTGSEPTP